MVFDKDFYIWNLSQRARETNSILHRHSSSPPRYLIKSRWTDNVRDKPQSRLFHPDIVIQPRYHRLRETMSLTRGVVTLKLNDRQGIDTKKWDKALCLARCAELHRCISWGIHFVHALAPFVLKPFDGNLAVLLIDGSHLLATIVGTLL